MISSNQWLLADITKILFAFQRDSIISFFKLLRTSNHNFDLNYLISIRTLYLSTIINPCLNLIILKFEFRLTFFKILTEKTYFKITNHFTHHLNNITSLFEYFTNNHLLNKFIVSERSKNCFVENQLATFSYSLDVDGMDRLSRKMAISMGRPSCSIDIFSRLICSTTISVNSHRRRVISILDRLHPANCSGENLHNTSCIMHAEVGPLPIYPWWGCNNWLWGVPSGIGGGWLWPHVDTWLIIRLFGNKLRLPSMKFVRFKTTLFEQNFIDSLFMQILGEDR